MTNRVTRMVLGYVCLIFGIYNIGILFGWWTSLLGFGWDLTLLILTGITLFFIQPSPVDNSE